MPRVSVVLLSSWREDGVLTLSHRLSRDCLPASLSISEECVEGEHTGVVAAELAVRLSPAAATEAAELYEPPEIIITAHVPEKMHMSIYNYLGDITVTGKVEGDSILSSSVGDITVDKLRGHKICLSSQVCPSTGLGGGIFVKKLIEAETLSLSASAGGSVQAKMLNGRDVTVSVGVDGTRQSSAAPSSRRPSCIDIGSIYSHLPSHPVSVSLVPTTLTCSRSPSSFNGDPTPLIRLGSTHGPLSVTLHPPPSPSSPFVPSFSSSGVPVPLVEVGGVSGSLTVDVLIPSLPVESLAARVHFDATPQNTWSSVTAMAGALHVTVDRKVDADIRLMACKTTDFGHRQAKVLDGELDFDEGETSSSSGLTTKPTTTTTTTHTLIDLSGSSLTPDDGHPLENKSASYLSGRLTPSGEPASRHDVKLGNRNPRAAGKIDAEGARKQANFAFVGHGKDNKAEEERPMITVGTRGEVKIETMSWMAQIKRKFGVVDKDTNSSTKQEQ